ncbi:MAG: LacI family DNA-binding transcriptional regulator [Myxococcales bacterium]
MKRSTIRDVAERAGVSTATVSFVLNNNPNEVISDKVKKRVLEAAAALSYHPSATAAGLKRKHTHNVGLIFYKEDDAIANQFYSYVVQGAVKEAVERDYNLLFSFMGSSYTGFNDLPKVIRERNVEGVLFIRQTLPKMIKDLQAFGLPIVAIDNTPRIKGIDSLQIDNRLGAGLAAAHLVELGHQRLAFLGPVEPPPSIEERGDGFSERATSFGAPKPQLIAAAEFTFDAAYAATLKALKAKGKALPTAIFCANDVMAAGALRAAREAELRVPHDLSVIGFDDIAMSRYTDPPLTTIGVVKEHLGRRAMGLLIERIQGSTAKVFAELAPVSLVLRSSTAAPRAR